MIDQPSGRAHPPTRVAGIWGRTVALAVAWSWLWTSGIAASDNWVAPNGRDAPGRGGRTGPWATLQYAADRVRPGDTVHVRDGEYRGFYLARGGTHDAPVRFRAEGEHVRIAARNPKTPDGINIEGANHVIVEGFTIDEMPRAGIRVTHSDQSTIRQIRAHRNRNWGIFTSFCNDILIEGNLASGSAREHGIYVSNSGDRPVIRGNVCRGNRQCGIHMNGDVNAGGDGMISGALVENNIIYDNGSAGGSAINCDGVQDSTIRNNLLYENHSSGISFYRIDGAAGSQNNRVVNNTILMARDARWSMNIKNHSTGVLLRNNILLNNNPSRGSINIAPDSLAGFRSDYNIVADRLSPDDGSRILSLRSWATGTGLDRHSLAATPQEVFVNATAGDYHLRAGSPAIDAADPSGSPPQDLEGHQRPAGSRSDIGAFEFGR